MFHEALYHHQMGSAALTDPVVLGKGLSRVAEWYLIPSSDGQRAAAVVVFGDGPPNWIYLRDGSRWELVATPRAGVPSWETKPTDVAFTSTHALAIATEGTPRGRIVMLERGMKTLVPQGDWAMDGIAPVAGGFLITEVWGPDWRIRQFTEDGRYVRTVALPKSGIGVDNVMSRADSPYALISYQGWTISPRWARYDATNGALQQVFAVRPPADYSDITFARIDAAAADGTRVPVTILAKRGTALNGRAPTILTAYGSYGISSAPHFLGRNLAWIERGGVEAVANIRGGGEFGEAWHKAGALLNEQHRFDDLNAAAQALIAARWTSARRLGITGGSAGGLLMGGALTQRPDLYRAVVSFVGNYDMLRDELFYNGVYNITEFGTVRDRAQFQVMYAYSPLHRVRDGIAYPALLLITGENDPRVAPWQSRKFAARMQAASSSGHPVIILTRRAEGHGIGESFSQGLDNTAAELIFLSGELGLSQ